MKIIAAIFILLALAACQGTQRGDLDGDTLRSVKRDVDTVVDRFTDKVDSVTETILDSAKSKGPRLIKKGEEAVRNAMDSIKKIDK